MRSKTITVNEKTISLQEYKIKTLKNEVIPRLGPAMDAIAKGEFTSFVDVLGEQLKVIFPELKDVDLEECYPSEIEAFVEAWIEVNFTGLKRLAGPLMSLIKMGQQLPGFALARPSGSQTTGKG